MRGENQHHTHYNSPDALSIFSATDIKAIYEAYRAMCTNSLGTFTAGVVTASGTTYLVKVEDPIAFLNFGNEHFRFENDFTNFEQNNCVLLNSIFSESMQEMGFLQAFQGAGLVLFKGNSDFSQWNRRSLDGNTPINNNCNE